MASVIAPLSALATVGDQLITDRYALYNGDCCEVLPRIPDNSIHLSVYSPPFAGLYHYSSSENDLSNCQSHTQFLEHYDFVVREIARVTIPGRLTVVHCMDLARGSDLVDLPGDIVRVHERHGFIYHDRKTIWKEPLKVAMRTRALGLRHSQLVKDASLCRSALADYVLVFRKRGTNPIPVLHDTGLTSYAGADAPPEDLVARYRNWHDPKTNKLSHFIWRRYASSVWMDIRVDRVLPYKTARESQEEKHVHPLQLDTIERCTALWSNPGETVLTPFAGVGSEVYKPVQMGRRGIGIELKPSYYRQMVANVATASLPESEQGGLFDAAEETEGDNFEDEEQIAESLVPEESLESLGFGETTSRKRRKAVPA
jgi:hypothetical protein